MGDRRLSIICPFLNPYARTGGHRRYIELADDLARRGHRVWVLHSRLVSPRLTAAATIELPVTIKRGIVPFSIRFALASLVHFRTIRAAIPAADCVMIHGETHLLAARVLARRFGARLLYALRSNRVAEAGIYISLREGSGWQRLGVHLSRLRYRAYERLAGKWADGVAVQSRFDRDSYLSRVPHAEGKISIIPGNIGPPRFRKEDRDTNSSRSLHEIVYVGGLGKRKGTRYLIEAILALRDRGIPVRLTIVGSGGMLKEIAAFAESHHIVDAFRLLGRRDDPFPHIAEADLMIVPSLFDSYPDTVLEALHTGTPVIGTRVGGIPDMLCYDELLVPPADVQAISEKVTELHRDPGKYETVRRLCRQRRDSFEFDWTAEFERVILSICSDRHQ